LHELSEGHLRGNSRPLGFPTPREAWISSPWLSHLGTAFRRFQAEAPKWATKLPLEATELGAKLGNSLWCMPPYSESGRILLAEGTFESRLRRPCKLGGDLLTARYRECKLESSLSGTFQGPGGAWASEIDECCAVDPHGKSRRINRLIVPSPRLKLPAAF
jgi:hypothetical protein